MKTWFAKGGCSDMTSSMINSSLRALTLALLREWSSSTCVSAGYLDRKGLPWGMALFALCLST